jgi:hypothetical protein
MRAFASYTLIVAVSVVVVINPLVVWVLTQQRGLALYVVLLDLWLLAAAGASWLYLRRGRRLYFRVAVGLLLTLLPALLAGEIAYDFVRYRYVDRMLGRLPAIHRPDPLLVYTLTPEAVGRHSRQGEFDVEYVVDHEGRKRIDDCPGAKRTIHVFGDSFTFGFGVGNADTWLNLLSARLGEEMGVCNHGVIGYGIEQMYLAQERRAEQFRPGDIVIFAPIAVDLQRGLVSGTYACGNRILGQISPDGHQTYPKLQAGRWLSADLRDECNFLLDTVMASTRLRWSFGYLYREWRHRSRHDDIIANADQIFAMAEASATARGAEFHVVFLPTPRECQVGRFTVDLDDLQTRHWSLLPHCPDDPEAARALSFPFDTHWSPQGHMWAAAAFHDLLPQLAR